MHLKSNLYSNRLLIIVREDDDDDDDDPNSHSYHNNNCVICDQSWDCQHVIYIIVDNNRKLCYTNKHACNMQ